MKAIEATRQAGGRIKGRMLAGAVTATLVFAGPLAVVPLAVTARVPARQAPAQPSVPAHHHTGARGAVPSGAAASGEHDYKRACPVAPPGQMACMALIRTDLPHYLQPADAPNMPPTGYGYGPPDLQSAYKLPSSTAGSGQTVAVVAAFDDPNAAADLAAYRAAWMLPPLCNGCFEKVNQNGQTSPLPPPNS